MLAVFRELGTGAAIERVGARRCFRERVSPNNFTRAQPGQIFLLLLFSAEVHDRQRADAGVSAPCGSETGVLGDVIRNDRGRDLVHLQAAVSFGDLNRAETELAGFLQQLAGDREVFVLHLLDVGDDLVDGELFRRLADHLVLLGEIFRSEDLVGPALFEQKAAAGDFSLGYCRDCRHHLSLRIRFHHRRTEP